MHVYVYVGYYLLLYNQVFKSIDFSFYGLFLSFVWPDSKDVLVMQIFDGSHASTVLIL